MILSRHDSVASWFRFLMFRVPLVAVGRAGLQSVRIAQFREGFFSALSAPLRAPREKGEFGCGWPRCGLRPFTIYHFALIISQEVVPRPFQWNEGNQWNGGNV
jgi:hypothetical protein